MKSCRLTGSADVENGMNTGSYDVDGGKGGPGRFEIRRVAHACGLVAGALLARKNLVRNDSKFSGAFCPPKVAGE